MRNKVLYIVSLCLIGWSILCVFRLIELIDIYKIVLDEDFSLFSILFVDFFILYEIIVCLFLGIVLNTKKFEGFKYEAI
jgi:uncharacterized Tic20 family protein